MNNEEFTDDLIVSLVQIRQLLVIGENEDALILLEDLIEELDVNQN